MKLEIDNGSYPNVRLLSIILKRSFDVAIREYGIAAMTGTVKLSLEPFDPDEVMIGVRRDTGKPEVVSAAGIEGKTFNELLPGNVSLVTLMPNPYTGVDGIIIAWCHELKHVAQHMLGEWSAEKGSARITWMGKVMTNAEAYAAPHDERPWERDAIDASHRLLPLVIKDLKGYANTEEGRAQFELAKREAIETLLNQEEVQGHA